MTTKSVKSDPVMREENRMIAKNARRFPDHSTRKRVRIGYAWCACRRDGVTPRPKKA